MTWNGHGLFYGNERLGSKAENTYSRCLHWLIGFGPEDRNSRVTPLIAMAPL